MESPQALAHIAEHTNPEIIPTPDTHVERRHTFGKIAAKLALPLALLSLGGAATPAVAAENIVQPEPIMAPANPSSSYIEKKLQVLNAENMRRHVELGGQDEGAVNSIDPTRTESAMVFSKNLGASWWRIMLHPNDTKTEEGWEKYDIAVGLANKHKLKVNITATCEGVQWTEESIKQYVSDIALRYGDKIKSIAICNEPNYENEVNKGWLIRLPGMDLPESYGSIFRWAEERLRKIAPELDVWFGELSSKPGITPEEKWRTLLEFFERAVACPDDKDTCPPVTADAATTHGYQLTSNPLYPSPVKGEIGIGSAEQINMLLVLLYAVGKIQTPDGKVPPFLITEMAQLASTRDEGKKLDELARRTGKISGIRKRFTSEKVRSTNYRNMIRVACSIANLRVLMIYGVNSPDPAWPGWFNPALRDVDGTSLPTANTIRSQAKNNTACIKSPFLQSKPGTTNSLR